MIVFPDSTLQKKGVGVYNRLKKRGDEAFPRITFPVCHVKEEHLYVEARLKLKTGREFEYPFAVDLQEALLNGHKADDIAELEFNLAKEAFQHSLDFYGDDWEAEDFVDG